jgi:UPF0755 protein
MKRTALLLAGLLVLAGLGVAGWVLVRSEQRYKGYDATEQFVEIPQGAGSTLIGRRLAEAGVVRDELSFRIALWRSGQGRRLQAGEYRFDTALTAREVIDRIARGDVFLRPITFPEGLTIRQKAELFERAGFGAAEDFRQAASHGALVHDLDPHAPDLEGYLFPSTYALPRGATAEQLVQRMVATVRSTLTSDLVERAAERGLSIRELVTLASLIEKETAKPEERPIVSGVYTNRLRIGMGLQCDPTVIYALERAGLYDGNLTRQNLRFDSPYNTYVYAGLPPGPIAAPGRASLEAAANPAEVPYFYFVSRNDGSHVFSVTYDEHRRKVHEYQVLPFRGGS